MKKYIFLLLILICFTLGATAQSKELSYTAYITDAVGTALNGNYTIYFSLYDVESGGAALWTESQSVDITDGEIAVRLGAVTPINLAFDAQYWLGIKIGTDPEASPRQKLTMAAYAVQADDVAGKAITPDTVTGNSVDATIIDSLSYRVNGTEIIDATGTFLGTITETDPSVPANLKDGVAWSEVSGIPADIADGDNVGITIESDPSVPANLKDGVSWTEIADIPADIADGDNVGITVESDPSVPANLKDGVDWSEVSGIPADIADGDAVGITIESDPSVPANLKDGVDWSEVADKPAGLNDITNEIHSLKASIDALNLRANALENMTQNQNWLSLVGGNGDDMILDTIVTPDNGFLAVGTAYSAAIGSSTNHGGSDVMVVKLNSLGQIEWQRLYGGSSSDTGAGAVKTADGGYLIAGTSSSTNIAGTAPVGGSDAYMIKIDDRGNIQWQRLYGSPGDDTVYGVARGGDNGFLLCGTMYNPAPGTDGFDGFVIRTNSTGNLYWNKTFGYPAEREYVLGISNTNDDCFILTGSRVYRSMGEIYGDMVITKIDLGGNPRWERRLVGAHEEMANGAVEAADGSIIVTGYTRSTDFNGNQLKGQADAVIVKLSDKGNPVWIKTYGGASEDHGKAVAITKDGGILMAGFTQSSDIPGQTPAGSTDIYLVKTDGAGVVQWQKQYGGTSEDHILEIYQTQNGFIASGISMSPEVLGKTAHGGEDGIILKLGTEGELR